MGKKASKRTISCHLEVIDLYEKEKERISQLGLLEWIPCGYFIEMISDKTEYSKSSIKKIIRGSNNANSK